MNKQTGIVTYACLVSGALGAFGVSLLSTPAEARDGAVVGRPYIVGTSATTLSDGSAAKSPGLLFRTWSDGTVDVVGYVISWPNGYVFEVCSDAPPSEPPCYRSYGIVPEYPPLLGDLNVDGIVDGADVGLMLGQWSGTPSAR